MIRRVDTKRDYNVYVFVIVLEYIYLLNLAYTVCILTIYKDIQLVCLFLTKFSSFSWW